MDEASPEVRRQIWQSKVLSRLTAAIMTALMLAFFVVTMNNTTTILESAQRIKDGPYPVSVAAGHLETYFTQLQTVVIRAQNYIPLSISGMDRIYDSANAEIEYNIQEIFDSDWGSDTEAETLRIGFEELLRQEAHLRELSSGDATLEEIHDYATDEMDPLINELLATSLNMLNESTQAVEDAYATVDEASRQTVFISWNLIVVVIISLFVYLALLRRKTIREEQLAQELELVAEKAQSANKAKSTFLSSMSHDIRTPMNAIIGLTSIAQNHIDDKERVEYCLARITTASKHLLSLVNDVLDMSEIETGKIVLNNELFSLPDLLDELTTIVSPQAKSKNLNLEISMWDVTDQMLIGDTLRLNQILLNLISNAVKYTNEGGNVRVVVTEDPSPVPNCSNYTFVVQDNGIGMEPEFLNYIFEPFERERNETTPFTEGAGLGMAITKTVVDLMGGTIQIESEPGMGSTFTVVVPLKMADEGDLSARETTKRWKRTKAVAGAADVDVRSISSDGAPEFASESEPKPEPEPEPEPLSGKVLLVEDDALNREIAVELIQSLGVDVDTANNGLEALQTMEAAAQGAYQLIFMDCQMPVMGGMEATERIIEMEAREGRPHTPIVTMTANAFNEDREKAMAVGMDGFMSKPISMSELEKNLRQYLMQDNRTENQDSFKESDAK